MAKAKKKELEKLVEDIPIVSLNGKGIQWLSTKRQPRKLVPAHIRSRLVDGHLYYYYVWGTDKEIYLGSAPAILKAVRQNSTKRQRVSL